MYTLYMKPGCPHSAKVLQAVKGYDFEITEKDITDDAAAEELIALGGKRQTPYLYDHEHEVGMYESGDIISYLVVGASGDATASEAGGADETAGGGGE